MIAGFFVALIVCTIVLVQACVSIVHVARERPANEALVKYVNRTQR